MKKRHGNYGISCGAALFAIAGFVSQTRVPIFLMPIAIFVELRKKRWSNRTISTEVRDITTD